jgi:K+-transporting ATPase KdpF subunit
MKKFILKSATMIALVPGPTGDHTISYVIGSVIALLIMGYLIYSLLHPEKF